MDRKNKRIKLRIIIGLLVVVLVVFVIINLPDRNMHLIFCEVGQGDAILVTYKNNQILIDGGLPQNYGRLLSCLSSKIPFWDRTLEVVVNTHPDEDHFGGLAEIVKRYRIVSFMHNGYDNSQSWRFEEFKKSLIDKKVCSKANPPVVAFSKDKLYFESHFPFLDKNQPSDQLQPKYFDKNKKCLKPEFKETTDNLNNSSIVLQLNYGDFDALLTGDIESEIEEILVWRDKIQPVEILKIAHHGSKTSTTEELLMAAEPEMAVISVGENSFGHPAQEVLNRLRKFNIPFLRTDEEGTIEIVSDGNKWWLN
jgi:competence protein ComEC